MARVSVFNSEFVKTERQIKYKLSSGFKIYEKGSFSLVFGWILENPVELKGDIMLPCCHLTPLAIIWKTTSYPPKP